MLRISNFDLHFMVEYDESGNHLGAVLMQEGHPLAYSSQGLKGKASLLSVYEKEMLVILLFAGQMKIISPWKAFCHQNGPTEHQISS